MPTYFSNLYETVDGVAKDLKVPEPKFKGQAITRRGKVRLTAAPAINDILKFCEMPKGCVLTSFYVAADELDTNGTPTGTLHFGYAGHSSTDDPDAFLASMALGATLNVKTNIDAPITFYDFNGDTNQLTLQALLPAAFATAAAANEDVYFSVTYTRP